MARRLLLCPLIAASLIGLLWGGRLSAQEATAELGKRYLQDHCLRCHDANKKSGGVRLDDLSFEPGKHAERWQAVRDQVRDGLMPPLKEPRPEATASRNLVAWITARTDNGKAARLPNKGNLIPHELLFGKSAGPVMPPEERIWRLSPAGYLGWVQSVSRGRPSITQPFTLIPERGIRDYAGLYTIDEAGTEILLRNAEAIVESQTAHEIKDDRIQGKNDSVREFVALMDPRTEPTRAQLEAAIQMQFRMAIGRTASAEEVERLLKLHARCAQGKDWPGAARTLLQAVLLRADAMFRTERGLGGDNRTGPRMLAPTELAVAISLALGDQRDQTLMTAAQKGELTTREQIAAHVRRLLDDPRRYDLKSDRSGLRFFREYFEYGNATEVFKDKPKDFVHSPATYVSDTDRLVLHILRQDRNVLTELLTTPQSFVNYTLVRNKQLQKDEAKPLVILNPNNDRGKVGPDAIYGFKEWPAEQPVRIPEGQRLGILMQPSWLVAYSTNFETDPVRRGRWIRERLLGGTVPDLPIGVVAQVPDEKHRTFRDRLSVTRDPKCWKCHVKMDDLGLPFEQYDHFGRYRTSEEVLDPEKTARNVDPKGKHLGPVLRPAPLDTTGKITDSGDAAIDGDIATPQAMLKKLAGSERVRQVFVRHVFRYYLGRNETLSDARTLQEADRAYVVSGGSFKAMLVSLLTSDSFLYRSPITTTPAPEGSK